MSLDYRDVVSMKEKPEGKLSGQVKQRWWEVPEEDLARAVIDVGEDLETNDSERQQALVRHARLYENCEIDSLNGSGYAESVARHLAVSTGGALSLNVGATCLDTITAKVTKNKPRPYFLTSGASWAGQIKARNLDKWSRGFIYQTKFYQKARPVFVDGCEFGTGFLQVFPNEDDRLDCERVLPSEIFVDKLDGQYGAPRQMLRLKYISRDILKRLFPKHAQAIDDAGRTSRIEDSNAAPEVIENTIKVWEAWHLPSGKKAKDGKHCIAIDGAALLCEDWKIQKFPFVVYRFKKRTTGFDGKGVIETVQPVQVELNRGVRSVGSQMRRKGKGRTWVPMGSKVNVKAMTNADGGDIGYYTGQTPPVVDNGNAVASEDMQWIMFLHTQAFQLCGVSEMSANSKKPAGLDAAVALREFSDIESERFAVQHQDWEQFGLDYMELSIDLITKQYGWKGYKVLVPGRRDLLEVDWAKIDLDRDSYVMQMWPTSSLPGTPAARLQRVEELRSKGYITDAQAKRLLEFPDIEAEMHLANAIIDDADATISAILDDEEPKLMPLEPYQNLDMIIERANASYLWARHRHCPEDRLTLLRNLIDTATAQKAAMLTPPPMPGMPPGAPGAMPPGAPPGMPPGAPSGAPVINNTMNAAPPAPAVPPLVA